MRIKMTFVINYLIITSTCLWFSGVTNILRTTMIAMNLIIYMVLLFITKFFHFFSSGLIHSLPSSFPFSSTKFYFALIYFHFLLTRVSIINKVK